MELPPKIKENKATSTYDIVLGPFKASEEVVQQSARRLLLQNVLYPKGNGQPEQVGKGGKAWGGAPRSSSVEVILCT